MPPTASDVATRLANLTHLSGVPANELAWLVAHGQLETHAAGAVVAPRGQRIHKLWILLSGRIAVRVDRGTGPRRVIVWTAGEVSGMLPYSRMTGPPGDNYCEEDTELLTIDEALFPEMINRCPVFTTGTVHLMLDRARGFNTSDLQDEKMISLGRLAAGLAHELNNPASAALRGAKRLADSLVDADAALHAVRAAGLTPDLFDAIDRARQTCRIGSAVPWSALERTDREDEIAGWLTRHGLDATSAAALADTAITMEALDDLAAATSRDALAAALGWIAAGCGTRALATTIEQAATRVYDLVSAVKRFTYMDQPGPDDITVEAGLRDTIRMLAAKTTARSAQITLNLAPDLPHVRAAGSELNQVWFALIDNALDAVAPGGHVAIDARPLGDRVVVRIVDDGPGIPPEVLPRVFDPFFTTKPPGQGTGLGLAIARQLVRGHNGEISVQSVPGRTEFAVSLLIAGPGPDRTETSSAPA